MIRTWIRRTGQSAPGRRTASGVALFAASAVLAAGCSGSLTLTGKRDPSGEASGKASATATAPAAKITLMPENGAGNVGIATDKVKAAVTQGTLSSVTLTDQAGTAVPGRFDRSRTSWVPRNRLDRGTAYTLTARAEDPAGKSASRTSHFTTVSPENSAIAFYTPEDRSTAGVGMEVSLRFDKPVTAKKAVESAVRIKATGGQKAVGHWFGGNRLDFRPKEFWKPGTTVKVSLDLDGVEISDGVYGVQDTDFSFEVGREQISTVDARTQTMTVRRDGKTIRTIPVSTGEPQYATYNGTMVVTEQLEETRMESSTVGLGDEYDITDVPHAQRLTESGTFIHGNYWASPDTFGARATSHGCIGLRDVQGGGDSSVDGAWFYDNSLLGDVVVVENSTDGGTVSGDNGLNGWNLDWAAWKAGSALR